MPADDLSRAARQEWLRQARAAFRQRQDHHERWFAHRIMIERIVVVSLLIVACLIVCGAVVLAITDSFGTLDAKSIALVTSALAPALGLLGSAPRLFASRAPADLEPVVWLAADPAAPPESDDAT